MLTRSLGQRLHEPHAGLLVADVAVKVVSLTAMIAAGQRDGHRTLLPRPFLKSLHEKRPNPAPAPAFMDDESRQASEGAVVLDGEVEESSSETHDLLAFTGD
jgi:hypothetical protein